MTELNKIKQLLANMAKPEQTQKGQGHCVCCKQPAMANCHSDAGRREFIISGMCEKCFDTQLGPNE